MNPLSYTTPSFVSLPDNFPAVSVNDNTKNQFSSYTAPDSFRVNNPWRNETHTHFHVAQAYGLNSPVVRDSVHGQVTIRAENSWYTGVVMPLVEIRDNSFSVNTMRFEETFAPVTPAEGIPTITEVKSDETNYTITRRAKAFVMEHEYMTTEKGRRHYLMNLKHLATITFEVMCYDVVHALINAKNACLDYEVEYGYYNNKTESEILAREREFWCALQKQDFGFQKLDTRVSQLHMRYGIRNLDTYIFPVEPKDWLSVTPEENTTYSKGGPAAVNQIQSVIGNAIDGTSPLGILNNRYKVYMTRTYTTGPNGSQENLMMRERHIGEFNRMLPLKEERGETYNSTKRTIKIYDEDADRFKDITLKAALEASDMLFTESGINTQYKRTHPENFDEDMKENFLFKPTNKYAVNSVAPITYFGQMREKHLSTDTVISFGNSCVAALAKELGKLPHDINGIITDAVNTIQMHNDSVTMNNFMNDIILHFRDQLENNRGGVITKVIPAKDKLDTTRTLFIPSIPADKVRALFINGPELLNDILKINTTNNPQETIIKANTEGLHKIINTIVHKFSRVCQGNPLLPMDQASLLESHAILLKFFFPQLTNGYTVWFTKSSIVTPNHSDRTNSIFGLYLVFSVVISNNIINTTKAKIVLDNVKKMLIAGIESEAGKKVRDIIDELIFKGNTDKTDETDETDVTDATEEDIEFLKEFKKITEEFIDAVGNAEGKPLKIPKSLNEVSAFRIYFENTPSRLWTCQYQITSLSVLEDLISALFNILIEDGPKSPIIQTLSGTVKGIIYRSKGNAEKLLSELVKVLGSNTSFEKKFDLSNIELLKTERVANRDWWEINSIYGSKPDAKTFMVAGKITREGRNIKDTGDTSYIRTPFRIPKQKLGEFIGWVLRNETTAGYQDFPELRITISTDENPNYPLAFNALQSLYKNSEYYSPVLLSEATSAGDKRNRLWRTDTTDDDITEILQNDQTKQQDVQKSKQSMSRGVFTSPSSVTSTVTYTTTDVLDEIGMSDDDDFRKHIERVNMLATTPLNKLFGHVLLFTPITKTVLSSFIDNDLIFPIGFLIFRPHQRYQMAMAIKLKSGTDMGATYHNPSLRDYQEEDTAMTKRRIAHWSWHSKAQVTEPQLVFHVYDIFCNATLGGAGSEWYTSAQIDSYDSEEFQFAGKDIFAIAVPYEMYKEKPMDYIDASGSFSYYSFGNGRRTGKREPLHYNTAAFYNSYWGWRQSYERSSQQIESDYHPGATGEFRTHIMPKNTGMWMGSTQLWDDTTSRFVLHGGKGHFGIYAFPGMKDARNGQFKNWVVPDAITRLMV